MTPEAFRVFIRSACHLEPKLSPESALHTLRAARMYLVPKLEAYCKEYLQSLEDPDLVLQAMTVAAKLSYCFEREIQRKYWITLLLKSKKTVDSAAFLQAHGSIIAQLIKLEEFEVDEERLWTRLVEWSAQAVSQPEILGPFADAMGGEVAKRIKTAADDSNLGSHQKATLRLVLKHMRFGAMSKEFFFDKVRGYLTREESDEVMGYFLLGRKSDLVASKRRQLVGKEEQTPIEIESEPEGGRAFDLELLKRGTGNWRPSNEYHTLKVKICKPGCFNKAALTFSSQGALWSFQLQGKFAGAMIWESVGITAAGERQVFIHSQIAPRTYDELRVQPFNIDHLRIAPASLAALTKVAVPWHGQYNVYGVWHILCYLDLFGVW